MPRIRRREAAKRDLIAHFAYIGAHSTIEDADRFLESIRDSFAELAKMPRMGFPAKIQHGRFAGLRIWPVRDFPRHLIIYRPISDGIVVERVIHSAQDYQRVLR